ncbi:MAG: methyltransferase [Anaerolineales bacterium]
MILKPNVPYAGEHHYSVILGKDSIEVITKPGLPDWDLISPSTQLLAKYPVIKPTDSVLLYGCHQGALGVYLARSLPEGLLWLTDNNQTALDMIQMTLKANNISSANILIDIELPPRLYQKFNTVYIQIPKGRQLTRRWLVQAYNALLLEGSLYISGSNNTGIKTMINDAQELFGQGRILAYKKGNRVAQFIKKSVAELTPEWAQTPGIAPGTWVEYSIHLANYTFRIRSLPGVFSFAHLDEGTKMLLDITTILPGANVLDVGCGYGIIGLYAAAKGAGLVHLIDNNLLAVSSCNETLTLNRITNAKVFAGDLLNPIGSNKYDLVLSNPPFHTGHAVDLQIAQALIDQSWQALNPGGQLIIVANRFIRYDHLIKAIFGNVSTLTESGKFHVLSGLKSR